MKNFVCAAMLTFSVALLFGTVCQTVHAEEGIAATDGNVPAATLADFGLGQMQVLTDDQGRDIRGSGFYFISGHGHSYDYRQFRPVGKILYGHHHHGRHSHHGGHGHKHVHSNAHAIQHFAFHFQSKFFGHRGYRLFLPVIAAIHGGGAKHR